MYSSPSAGKIGCENDKLLKNSDGSNPESKRNLFIECDQFVDIAGTKLLKILAVVIDI